MFNVVKIKMQAFSSDQASLYQVSLSSLIIGDNNWLIDFLIDQLFPLFQW